jgi:hypothetical protein
VTWTTVPADIPALPWRSADARRWAAVRLPGWARPIWCAPVLLVAAIVMLAPFGWDERCTVAAPCGPMWLDAIGTAGFFVHVVWLFALPEAALVSAPLLLLWMADPGVRAGGDAPRVAHVAVAAALCWGWAAVAARLWTRRLQRALARGAAGGVVLPVPASADRRRRGALRIAAGLAGLVVAAVAAVIAVSGDRGDERHAAAARRMDAVVVADHAEDHVVVRLGDGSRHRAAAEFPEHYALGTAVPVLADGRWLRLAAEPYEDRTGWQVLTLVAGGAGAGLLLSGALVALRTRSLRRGTAPALRVLAERKHGFTVIRPADDPDGVPVLMYEPSGIGARPRGESVLYGLPAEGAELVLLSTRTSGDALVETMASRARPWAEPRPDPEPEKHAEHRREAEARVAEAAAAMKPAAGPVHWHGGPAGRAAGAVLLAGTAAYLVGGGPFGGSWWNWPLWIAGGLWLVDKAVSMITWRITADTAGLGVRRYLRTRHVPWADVTRVVRTPGGELIVRRVSGLDDLSMGSVAFPAVERTRRRPSRATRAAAELTVMIRNPELRP